MSKLNKNLWMRLRSRIGIWVLWLSLVILFLYFIILNHTPRYSHHMNSLRLRATNSVIGSLVADSATMGLHWIYDQSVIAEKISSAGVSPAFFQPPSCPYYQYESGRFSPYGDEIIPFLRSFARVHGIDKDDAASSSYDFFKIYSGRLNHVTKAFVANRDEGKAWDQCPIVDHQAQGIIKMPLTVARYCGHEDLLSKVEDVVSVIHTSDISVSSSKLLAIILERILQSNDTPAEAIAWAASIEQLGSGKYTDDMKDIISFINNDSVLVEFTQYAIKLSRVPFTDNSERFKRMGFFSRVVERLLKLKSLHAAVGALSEEDKAFEASLQDQIRLHSDGSADLEWAAPVTSSEVTIPAVAAALGLSCAVPGAILTSFYIARKAFTYKEAVEVNILAGGDNCSRSLVVGGLFAAAANPDVAHIPVEWIQSTKPGLLDEVSSLVQEIVNDNSLLG